MAKPSKTPIMDAIERLGRVEEAAKWLVANRGKRGEEQAWRLLEKALNS